ncbi:MAG: hypothetical protein QME57_00405 [Patescibacteria group bacterium]|nr:hypothetical protein [Patescibacteria group bacterium]
MYKIYENIGNTFIISEIVSLGKILNKMALISLKENRLIVFEISLHYLDLF